MMLFVGGDGSGCTRLIHYLKKSGRGALFYFTDPTSPSMFSGSKYLAGCSVRMTRIINI